MNSSIIYILIVLSSLKCFTFNSYAVSKTSPQAGIVGITGDTTICAGDSALITISISGAVAPYSISIDGPQDYIFNDTTATEINFYVKESGSYRIVTATDGLEEEMDKSPETAIISFYPMLTPQTSGSEEICPGEETKIPVFFDPYPESFPVTLGYTRNNSDFAEIDSIPYSTFYEFTVNQPGSYELTQVIDTFGCISNITTGNTFTINALSEPSALIVGNATICRNSSVPVTVLLEGQSPWEITYSRNGVTDGTIENITQTPHSFLVNRDGTYQIEQVLDKNCTGDGSGSAIIDYYPETNVDIIGLSNTYSLNSPPVDLNGSPSGGVFTGPGVVTSDNKFYPNLAGVEGSPHEILYAYTNPDNNCTSYDTALVSVIDSVASIFIIDEKPVYCYNDRPITIIGSNIENQIGSFSIEGGKGLTDNFDNTATVNPAILKNGTFVITYSFFDGESIFSIEKQITIEFINPLYFIDFEGNSSCKNGQPVELEGNNPNGIFTGDGVTGNLVDGFVFDPKLANVGLDSIIYSFTSVNGCIRDTFETVTIFDIPRIDFTVGDSCVSDQQPSPIQFINLTESIDPVVQWNWNFNDNTSGQDNFSTLENPTHVYKSAGPRNVSLRAATNKGCNATKEINIAFGDKPLADFTFETECFVGDSAIQFTDETESRTAISNYTWHFYDQGSTTTSNEQNPEYVFSALSNYIVDLIVTTEFGCTDTMEKEIFLRPTFTLADGPHLQDFEIGQGSWVANKAAGSDILSWEFGELTGNIFNDPVPGNTAWYTNLVEREPESSWITSPCFNFNGTDRPYIKMDIWRAFEQNRDGAVLQSTTDNGRTWRNIGSINDGINWYNSFDIEGEPGGQAIGWSDNTDNQWVEARHRLDSLINRTNVQFRVAYGSDGTGINNEGFAFDNIWISSRNKNVLMEHFTNVGDSLHNASNKVVRDLNLKNPEDMIEIQYHLPAPGIDSFHLANPGGPNIRMIKYGLSGGPISIVNGKTIYQYNDEMDAPKNIDIITSSLTDAVFDITLTTSVNENIIQIESQTKALKAVTNREFSLQLAIVQDIAYHTVDGKPTTFYNVFRDFVPDAAGITYLGNWAKEDVRIEEFEYTVDDDMDPDNLSVIAFIQDENSNEILQVTTDQDSLATNIFNPAISTLEFLLFPNPASNHVYLKISTAVDDKFVAEIRDYTGKTVYKKNLYLSGNIYQLSLASLPKGIYIVSVKGKKISGTRKLVIF